MLKPYLIPIVNRSILIVKGHDRYQFLQDLITNDIDKLKAQPAIYALLLSPQGRFLHDFIITEYHQYLRLEIEATRKDDLTTLLTVYKLRSKITIEDESDHYRIYAWLGSLDTLAKDLHCYAYSDPRTDQMGYRLIIPVNHNIDMTGHFDTYDRHRLQIGVPDGSRDMPVNKAIPLEYGMDYLQAVSWEKGCYLGQELTARTKHRGIVRKGIFPAQFNGLPPEYGSKIMIDNHEVGRNLSYCHDMVLCRLRTDHSTDLFNGEHKLHYAGGTLHPVRPSWFVD